MQDRTSGDFLERRSGILQVSCFACQRLHRAEDLLEFNPLCPTCAARDPSGSPEMTPSYPLTHKKIDEMVTRTSPGNLALGYVDGTTFVVFYVGRSDSDVNHHLHGWVDAPSRQGAARAASGCRRRGRPVGNPVLDRVGAAVDSSYTRFAFSYAPSAKAAFERECRDYHGLGASDGLDNERHPLPALGSSWECPLHDR